MNRVKTPSCSKCKKNYQLPEANRLFRVPVLLNCGHDVCKLCLKSMFRSKDPIICEVCQAHTMIEDEKQLHQFPIHFYIIGKLWCLNSYKKHELNYNIAKLGMAGTPSTLLESNEKNCYKCLNIAHGICQDCNVLFCGNCFAEVHTENESLSQHKFFDIDYTHSSFPPRFKCDKHLKRLGYICLQCKLQLCLDCTSEGHQIHTVVTLNEYNSFQLPQLFELTTKGNNLLQNVSSSRDVMHKDMLNYENKLNKKNGDLANMKQKVADFIALVSGCLQNSEQTLINLLNEAEQSVLDSIINVLNNMNGFVNDLQNKITKIEQFMKHNQNSCETILDSIFAIENFLDTTLYVAKKKKIKPMITCHSGVFDAIQQCIDLKIGDYYFDTYVILMDFFSIPSDYTIVTSINYMTQNQERPTSSVSSNSTVSSNLSTSFVDLAITKPLQKLQLDYPIKELKQDKVEGITVTHVNSPSDFYLQLLDNNMVLKMINSEMNKFAETRAGQFGDIEMSNVLYAILNFNQKWYRGAVVNMKMELNEMLFTVHCIDYGFIQTVTADRIYRLPESVISIPPLAYNCALYSLKPKLTTGWSAIAVKDFNIFILEKKGAFFVYPINTHCEPYEVDVIWSNDINPLSTRDAMLCLNHGSSDVHTNVELRKQLLKTLTLPKPEKLQKGVTYDIRATHFISPSEFYFRIRSNITDNKFKNMMDKLQTKYKPTEVDTHKSYLLYSPQIGLAVAARYSLDRDWYRAKITSLPEPRMVTVFYVDYGNSETLPWDQLRLLDEGLLNHLKPLAIKACLADITPAEKGIETTKWTEDSFKAFVDLLQDHNNVDNTTACVLRIDGDEDEDDNVDDDDDDGGDVIHHVVVYNRWSREEFCVNRSLVNQGHAAAENLESCIFHKPNSRQIFNTAPEKTNVRVNDHVVLSSEDFVAFTKQRPITVSENHKWTPSKNGNLDLPGIEMLIHKVNSPDDIVLKYMDINIGSLTERMNKIYNADKKHLKKTDWEAKDVCATFIKKYGNWYRGKVLEIDITKKTASVLLYDLDEIHSAVSLNVLYNLDTRVVHDKCGFLHCSLMNLVPSGSSKGEWPRFVSDRLTEVLAKYRVVFFSKKGKKDDQAVGEIWVKDIVKPRALEPAQDRWININLFMIEQGFAMSEKQYKQDSSEHSTSTSDLEFNESFECPVSKQCWLPPAPLDPSTYVFNVMPSYVDMQCYIYFRTTDHDTEQLLQEVTENLNQEFCNSKPEPLNIKWTLGQMVIVQYHLDKNWYRGTITEVKNNNEFQVQFVDFGNIETCTHKDLRSTLYMTDIPQLCVKGFLSTICPLSKNKKWTEFDLDYVHTLIVEKPCTVVIDFTKSADNNYAITRMKNTAIKNPSESDICQFLVTMKKAYYLYMEGYRFDSYMIEEIDEPEVDNSLNLNYDKNTINKKSFEDSDSTVEKSDHGGYQDSKSHSEVEDDLTETSMEISIEIATNIEEEYLEDQENGFQSSTIIEGDDVSEGQLPVHCKEQSIDNIESEYEDCGHDENKEPSMTDIEINNYKEGQAVVSNGSRAEYIESLSDQNNRTRAELILKVNNDAKSGLIKYDELSNENIVLDDTDTVDKESSEVCDTHLEVTYIDALTSKLIDQTSTAQSATNEIDTEQMSYSAPSTHNIKNAKSEHNDGKRNLPIAKHMKKIHSVPKNSKDENVTNTNISFPKVSLKYSDAVEACVCEIKAPTRMTLVIEKIGGVDMVDRKMDLNNQLMKFIKHTCIPELDQIVPGTPVVLEHNYLWKRGTIADGGQSVYLVDYGVSIKLVKKNLRQCPIEFIEQPMFSIDCQLAHVTKTPYASSEDVMKKLTEVLDDVCLRVVEFNKLNRDVVEVELFNNKKEIAYQSLIDSGMLISE